MTETNDAKLSAKEQKAADLKARTEDMEKREKELNKDKSGRGTRVFLGMTRGRNPLEIQYEAFDESQPDTLPKTLSEFMEVSKVSDESLIVSFLIDGFNSAAYTAASDPVAEFVEAEWPEDIKKGFRVVVRNYSANAGVSIEDAVALIKPAYIASQTKK